MEIIIFSGFSFLVIFRGSLSEVMSLFSLTRWMETVLYSQMFYAIFQFCA